jgi:hypothetical protein
MFEAPGHEGLVTIRWEEVPRGGSFEGVRLGDHRRVYLEYEGEVSGGRGRVTRVMEGRLVARRGSDGAGGETWRIEGEGGWMVAGEAWSGEAWSGEAWSGPGVWRTGGAAAEERWRFQRQSRSEC